MVSETQGSHRDTQGELQEPDAGPCRERCTVDCGGTIRGELVPCGSGPAWCADRRRACDPRHAFRCGCPIW